MFKGRMLQNTLITVSLSLKLNLLITNLCNFHSSKNNTFYRIFLESCSNLQEWFDNLGNVTESIYTEFYIRWIRKFKKNCLKCFKSFAFIYLYPFCRFIIFPEKLSLLQNNHVWIISYQNGDNGNSLISKIQQSIKVLQRI